MHSATIVVNKGGMHHTSMALYFYRASKKSLHKPRVTSENMLFHISYGFNYYLQLLCLQFLSKTRLNLKKIHFAFKIALFPKSSLYQSMIFKILDRRKKLSHNN
jgi:hypothetical protein